MDNTDIIEDKQMKKHEAISEMIVDGLIMLLILLPLISTSAIGIFWIYYLGHRIFDLEFWN